MDMKTGSLILDFVLIAASLWMVYSVRGIGGVVGRSLSLIIAGVIVLGVAHLIATFGGPLLVAQLGSPTGGDFNNLLHRLIVLGGFVLVTLGFRQVRELTR